MNKNLLLITSLIFLGLGKNLQADSSFKWNFSFTPAQSVVIYYHFQFSPIAGQINVPGSKASIDVPAGDIATLNFDPLPGYTITSVIKDGKPLLDTAKGLTNLVVQPQTNGSINYVSTFNTTNVSSFVISCTPPPPPDPVGSFNFGAPSNSTNMTPVSTGMGNYSGIYEIRQYNFDVTTDETGKMIALGTIDGISGVSTTASPKALITGSSNVRPAVQTLNPNLTLDGSLATAKGLPTAAISSSLNLDLNTLPVKTTLQSTVLFIGGKSLSATSSLNATVGGKKFPLSNISTTIPAPPGVASQSWSFKLDIAKGTGAAVKKTLASSLLKLPTGQYVSFAQKAIKYSVKKGYSITFTNGALSDSSGNPVLSSGKKSVVKNASLTFTGLTLSGSGSVWIPTGGTVKYKFLGQTGTANIRDFNPAH